MAELELTRGEEEGAETAPAQPRKKAGASRLGRRALAVVAVVISTGLATPTLTPRTDGALRTRRGKPV